MLGFGKTHVTGQPVIINCFQQSALVRLLRSATRVENLKAKLGRLRNRERTPLIEQELANTIVAIRSWTKVHELAEFEIKQESTS